MPSDGAISPLPSSKVWKNGSPWHLHLFRIDAFIAKSICPRKAPEISSHIVYQGSRKKGLASARRQTWPEVHVMVDGGRGDWIEALIGLLHVPKMRAQEIGSLAQLDRKDFAHDRRLGSERPVSMAG